jgi:hypothetical protein
MANEDEYKAAATTSQTQLVRAMSMSPIVKPLRFLGFVALRAAAADALGCPTLVPLAEVRLHEEDVCRAVIEAVLTSLRSAAGNQRWQRRLGLPVVRTAQDLTHASRLVRIEIPRER